ncbi:MAG TPA: hypothetical protein VF500_19635 [Mucilaginibacter sp.]
MGEEVPSRQADLLQGDYSHEAYIDGILKKVEIYENDHLIGGDYYLSEDENIQCVIQRLRDVWDYGTFLVRKQQDRDHTLWDWELYNRTEILEQGKRVLDNQNRIIAEQYIDPSTKKIKSTHKYCYLKHLGNFIDSGRIANYGTIEFTYNLCEPDEIIVLVNLPGFDNEQYYITSDENVLNHPMIVPLFSWKTERYYNSDQLLPV